jgi:aquaporin Z
MNGEHTAAETWRAHWPEYAMEAVLLASFMIAANVFAILLFHPHFAAVHLLPSDDARRALMGVAMGLTCVMLVYSPFGRRSGAHMNPAVTLALWSLAKVRTGDATGYIVAQFIGGALGVAAMDLVAGAYLSHTHVNHVATLPGADVATTWIAELLISALLLTVVLLLANSDRTMRFAGIAAALLVSLFITFEAPISGMSMNPARTLARSRHPLCQAAPHA